MALLITLANNLMRINRLSQNVVSKTGTHRTRTEEGQLYPRTKVYTVIQNVGWNQMAF